MARSIPACAGEPPPNGTGGGKGGVYPRVCGGNHIWPQWGIRNHGLSPRVRGKPLGARCRRRATRSIPACAGETGFDRIACRPEWVYPRVCGGNLSASDGWLEWAGLSPRVRGKPGGRVARPPRVGSIPACAGETLAAGWPGRRVWGLSPRVRGKRTDIPGAVINDRSIPACAGETTSLNGGISALTVYPRVCGGNELFVGNLRVGQGLSPRVRGKQWPKTGCYHCRRSIPACAGETPQIAPITPTIEVYPRVCGGNMLKLMLELSGWGLSPRVRGKRHLINRPLPHYRSIPACAGETNPHHH